MINTWCSVHEDIDGGGVGEHADQRSRDKVLERPWIVVKVWSVVRGICQIKE